MNGRPPKPRLTPGRLLYLTWHAPRGYVRRRLREGPVNLWLADRGRMAMERAAWTLPACAAPSADAPEVHFLTGRRFWYQTAFCAMSLTQAGGRALRFVVIDDGTLELAQAAALTRILPGARIVGVEETERRLDEALPSDRFPTLRRLRLIYPHLRKLTDVHGGQAGWRVVLDSDMLFFAEPDVLLDWLAAPQRPLQMVDVEDAYGYAPDLLAELAGAPLPPKINVGVCGLRSDTLDWDRIEAWCARLIEDEGLHYLLEQALVAMLMATQDHEACPADRYIVAPSRTEAQVPTAALHHYVAEAKAWYFRFAWREARRRALGSGTGPKPAQAARN